MNPFSYGTIATGSHFYDRREETERIIATLSGGNNMVLFAPRRFGKTSLVFKVMEQMEKQGCVCVYFDFMPVFSPESFVRLYTKALSAKQTNLNRFAQTFTSIVKTLRPILSFGQDGSPEFSIDFANAKVDETLISDLLDIPEKMAGKDKRVVIFFDEFQESAKLNLIGFESLLRSKVQQQQKVNYLFFGSKTHLLNEMFNDRNKAFYNAASQMTLGHLPKVDSVHYLQKQFATSGISIDSSTADYLIEVAADIPHYIQMLAAEVWQSIITSQNNVTKEMVDTCAKRILALKGDYYMELFDRQSQSRKQLLKALTTGGRNIYSTDYVRQHRLPAIATIQRAVRDLISDGIIENSQDGYFITDPFFRIFISEM